MTASQIIGTEAEYHARHHEISNSMLTVAARSLEEFGGRYVYRTLEPEKKESDPLRIGRGIHCYCLESEKIDTDFWIRPEGLHGATKEYKALAASYEGSGKTELKFADFEMIKRMREGIMKNPSARALLEQPSNREFAVRWEDPATQLPLRCKFDALLYNTFFDIKSIASYGLRSMEYAIADRRYHVACYHYSQGFEAFMGFPPEPPQYIFAVKNTYQCDVVKFNADTMELAKFEWEELLKRLRAAYDKHGVGDPLAFFPDGWGGVAEVGIPWASKELGRQVDAACAVESNMIRNGV